MSEPRRLEPSVWEIPVGYVDGMRVPGIVFAVGLGFYFFGEVPHWSMWIGAPLVIAAGLMWYFGSGPIRGFAVVLMIGIVTSVFTAVNFTRMLVSLWIRSKRPRAINI